jgi:hypothetical protein
LSSAAAHGRAQARAQAAREARRRLVAALSPCRRDRSGVAWFAARAQLVPAVPRAGRVGQPRARGDPEHLDRSDTDPIHAPGQAWNALTVGAFTEKAVIADPKWSSWQPVARPGDLSPWSTTGVTFAEARPIKPDVVFEGGNVVRNAKGDIDFPCPDLSMLSTHYRPSEKSFVLSWAT